MSPGEITKINNLLKVWGKLHPTISVENDGDQSTLSILKAGLEDGDEIMCSVSNAATQVHHDVLKRNLSTAVTVDIHTPPGPPKIITPETNHVFIEGEELRAICITSPPGKPLGGLFWRWLVQPSQVDDDEIQRISGIGGKGGARLSDYTSVDAYLRSLDAGGLPRNPLTPEQASQLRPGDLISEDVQPLHYSLTKEKDQLVNTLTIQRISRRYHAAKLVCETGHPVGTAHQTSVTVYVKRECPANVTISVDSGGLHEDDSSGRQEMVVYARAGETKTFTCKTAPYYGQATIKWLFQASGNSITTPPKQIMDKAVTFKTPDGESTYQESQIQINVRAEDDRSYIDCLVWSVGDARIDARVRLDIIYPPDVPKITGYKSEQPINMAHLLELTCTTKSGNPRPELQWFKDKKPIPTSGEVITIGKQTSIKLKVVPQKEDNGAQYQCLARNTATNDEWISSEPVVLNVLFPPQRVSLSFGSKSVVHSGEQLVINCQADSSNPVAVITWRHYQCGPAHAFYRRHLLQQQQQQQHQQKLTNAISTSDGEKCKLLELKGSDESPVPGASGGLQARSHLWLRPTWRYHMDFIECQAENPVYGPPIWHDRLQLNVTFAPQFYGLQIGDQRVIREGETTRLDFGLYANPPVTSVSWFRHEERLPFEPKETGSLQGVYAAGSVGELLSLYKINRNNMGNYTVLASNGQHESKNTFFLNVTYPASILGKLEENITQINKEFSTLECKANANPAIASKAFTWYRYFPPKGWPEEVDEGALQLSEPIYCNESQVEKPKMSAHCDQQNKFHISSTFVIYKVTEEDVGKYVCEVNNGIGEPVKKIFNLLYHFPPKMIQLPRESDVTKSVKKYESFLTHIRPGLYKAQLALNDIRKSDFGSYVCQAANMQGEAQLGIHLSGTSTPDVPLNLRLLNATSTTLQVAWTQGFDGGSAQTFQIRWREIGSVSLYKYADVASNDNRNGVEYIITGLKPGTEYTVSVNSNNAKHGASAYTEPVNLRTLSLDAYGGRGPIPPLSSAGYSDDNALLIIVAACIFGFVILLVNAVVIIFLIKRRRHRNMLRQCKPDQGITLANGVALTRHDQSTTDMKQHLQSSFIDQNDNFADSDMSTTCVCCPPKKQNLISSGYVKADSYGNFSRTNGYTSHDVCPNQYSQHIAQEVDQQGQLVNHSMTSSIPDFNHLTSNQMTSVYPVRQITSPGPYYNNTTLNYPITRHSSTDLGMGYSSTNHVNQIRCEHGSIKHSNRHGQHTPRQANQYRYFGTLQNPNTYNKIRNNKSVADNSNINGRTSQYTLATSATSCGNPITVGHNGLGLTLVNDSFQLPTGTSASQNVVSNQTALLADSSTEILSTGLAAFTQIKRKSEFNDLNGGSNVNNGFISQNNLPGNSSPIVSIKVTSLADQFNPNSIDLGSNLATFSYNTPFDCNMDTSCTPIFLSLDPSASNSLLMSNSLMNCPIDNTKVLEVNREVSVTPLMIHSPTPDHVLVSNYVPTRPNLGGTRYFYSSREAIHSNISRQNIPHYESRLSMHNLPHAISSELYNRQNQCSCEQQLHAQQQHIPSHKRIPYSCSNCLKSRSSLHNIKQPLYASNAQNSVIDTFSEEDKDSDRSRYAEQLRRIQYSGGPTAQLLLGNVNIPNCHSSPDSALSPDNEANGLTELDPCLAKSNQSNDRSGNNHCISNTGRFTPSEHTLKKKKLTTSKLMYQNRQQNNHASEYQPTSSIDSSVIPKVDDNEMNSVHLSDCFV
uniref:Nephrin n=1 Tax=Trichobilharzia regenti TaxID=157069 RepID=A0AA85K862_TRIRE|nr:unnamed protein product [Trichobilharzia regenti]